MARRPIDSRLPRSTYFALYTASSVATVLMLGYLAARVTMVVRGRDYTLADMTMAIALLAAELFLAMHAVGYYFNLIKCGLRQGSLQPVMFVPHTTASVAVLVAAFNEAEDVLEATLSAARAMDYPCNLYLLDDSTRPECQDGAQRVAGKYGARLVHRTNRAGYKAGAINDVMPELIETYVALLDADQRPHQSWLKEMVALLEERPELALVQAPQHYVNDAGLPVCTAAKFQQAVFFEYICEGKSYSNSMFCCGSNVVIRRAALVSIKAVRDGRTQYFDERSVTEDFATTFLLHTSGWGTEYVNQPYAVGMGPETLPAYFTQQMRWAMGTQWQTRPILKTLFTNPRVMTPAQWWEYWMVGTYYFVGYAHFIFMLAPMMYMLFDVRPVRHNSALYLLFFVPYVLSSMNLFYFGMRQRRYSAKGVWLASALSFCTFWIYMKAGAVAVLGLKRAFGVTPKGVGGAIPLRKLWVEAAMLVGNYAVAVWCLWHLLRGDLHVGYVVNGVWAAYHGVVLSTLFVHFNTPVTVHPRAPLFAPATPAA